MNARPYQIEAANGVYRCWEEHQSTLAVMATGLGKTFLAAMLAVERANMGKCMFLAHREELIWQAAETMTAAFGQPPQIEMGQDYRAEQDMFSSRSGCVISTVQTQYSGAGGAGRMTKFKPDDFATLIVDEAHHYIAPAYRRVIDYYRQNPRLKILGITATPDRADKLAMGRLFESVAFDYGIREGIDDGWLVNIDQWTGTISGIDLSSVADVAGDLNAGQLAEVMERNGNVYAMADRTLERVGTRRSLVFAASVNHARLLSAIFNDRRPGSARFVFDGTPRDERRLMLAEYARGNFQFLCNVGIATEGFNDPGIECIVVGRPTKSRSLYTQMAGRGTRPIPGVVDQYDNAEDRKVSIAESCKPSCELIDFVGNAGRHKLIGAADILGGDYDTEVIARAKEMCVDTPGAMNVADALAAAQLEQIARRRQEEEEASRLARLRFTANCEYEQVDPFSHAGSNMNPNRRPAAQNRTRPPTENMIRFLDKHAPKGTDVDGMSIREAGKLIGEIRDRWERGMCSLDQSTVLKAKGLPHEIPKTVAKEWLNELAKNKWRVSPALVEKARNYADMVGVP